MSQDGFIWNVATGVPTKLGTLPGSNATPLAASHDGSVIVGYLEDVTTTNTIGARWDDNGVLTALTLIDTVDQAIGCSTDGSVIIELLNPGYWTGGGVTGHVLPPDSGSARLFTPVQGQTICSNNGSIIVGTSSSGPTRWANGVPSLLSDTIGGNSSRPLACSDDGSLIVGSTENFPTSGVFWRSGSQFQVQNPLDSFFTEASGCRSDGSVIYGFVPNDQPTGAYWTDLTTNNGDGTYGTLHQPTLPVSYSSAQGYIYASDVTMMAARINSATASWAARFTGTSPSILQILAGWIETTPTGMSGDGTVIAGYAVIAGVVENTNVGVTWDAVGNVSLLQTPTGYGDVFTTGISRNGSVVFGQANRLSNWYVTAPLTGASESGVGNLWMNNSFIDFSDPSVLAGFVNPDGSWIDVGYYGQEATGTYPVNYLTVQIGNTADDFLFNYGGDSWFVATTGIDPTTAAPYPINLMVDDCGPSASSAWVISASLSNEATNAGIGDVWMNEGFLDFSDPTIRAKFVNTDGTWKYLGVYGELPTGSSPLNWLRIQTGNAASDILTGYGLNSTQSNWVLLDTGSDPVTGLPYAAMSLDICAPFVAPIIPGPGDGSSSSSSTSSARGVGQTGGDKIRVDDDGDQWQQYLAWRDKQWRKRQAQRGILVNEPNIPPTPPAPVVAPARTPSPQVQFHGLTGRLQQLQNQMTVTRPLVPVTPAPQPPAPTPAPPLTGLPSQLDALRRQMKKR